MTKTIYGVGVNDASYSVYRREMVGGERKIVWTCPIYSAWKSMFVRCYSQKFQEKCPTYIGCTVSPEWHLFSNFAPWMESQDWKGKSLDKDILSPGNRVYGPRFCVFVSKAINTFVVGSDATRGDYPIGVHKRKLDGRFTATCGNPFTGKYEHLGMFDDPGSAHEAWRKRKHELACRYADMQTDPRVATALRTRFSCGPSSDKVA